MGDAAALRPRLKQNECGLVQTQRFPIATYGAPTRTTAFEQVYGVVEWRVVETKLLDKYDGVF